MCTSDTESFSLITTFVPFARSHAADVPSVAAWTRIKITPLFAINFRGILHVFNCTILHPYVSHITQWGTLEDISEIAFGGIKSSRIYPPDTETKSRRWHLLQLLTVSSLAQPAVNHCCWSRVLCSGFMCGFIFTYS